MMSRNGRMTATTTTTDDNEHSTRSHATTHLRDAHLVGSSGSLDVRAPAPAQDEGLEQVVAEALSEGGPDAVEHVGGGAGGKAREEKRG